MSAEIDLLIVDVGWPPETFIQRKLMALAQKGLRIAVASSLPSRQAQQFSLSGVRLIRLPHHDDNVLLRVLQVPPNVLRTVASPGGLFSACSGESSAGCFRRLFDGCTTRCLGIGQ